MTDSLDASKNTCNKQAKSGEQSISIINEVIAFFPAYSWTVHRKVA